MTDTAHKYRYSRQSPKANYQYMNLPYVPGHNIGFLKRRDMLASKQGSTNVQPYCTCRWKYEAWTNRKHAFLMFEKHLMDVLTQRSLFDADSLRGD